MLNLEFAHGRSGVEPQWKTCQKIAMEVVDFAVDFCGGFFGRKMQKKNPPKKSAGKSACRKQKNPPAHGPPRNPPAKSKNPPQNLPTNPPPVKPPSTRPVFSIEKNRSWRRLQSMDFGTVFGCLLGMVEASMLKCTRNPSAAAGGMDKVCCAPFQTTF